MNLSQLLVSLALGVALLAGCGGASAKGLDFEKASTDAKAYISPGDTGAQAALPPDAAQRLNKRYVDHLEWQFEFAQHSWSWHFYSTILLFFIVLLIVAFGLRITYLQFQKDYGLTPGDKPAAATPEQEKEAGKANTTLKLSAAGLELSSQIIGLFVLAFSLAFFYLYVKEVYPIQVLNLNQSDPQASNSRAKSSEASPSEAVKVKP